MSRKIVINTQERAVSSDINRLQSFAVRDALEAIRYRYLGNANDVEQPATSSYPSSTGTPLFAEILGGLMVRPQAGTFNLLIDDGALVAIDDTNRSVSSDDSPAVFVTSPGTTVPILANASGSVRIDVVECRLNPTPDIVTDNRDIFAEDTGLFSATSVTKELGDRLEFRVRQGTPALGYPAAVAGWLPLCVCRVPSGAANVDACDFWDVRPMLDDWAGAGANRALSGVSNIELSCIRNGAADVQISGWIDGRLNGRKVVGSVGKTTPGTFVLGKFDVADATNQDTGTIAEALTGNVYVYACRPFGLPRWAYYQPSPLARVPGPPGGILVASYTKPLSISPQASASIALPAGTGLVGSAVPAETLAICVVPRNVTSDRFSSFAGQNGTHLFDTNTVSIASSGYAAGVFTFSVPDTFWPPNAKGVLLRFASTPTLAGFSAICGFVSYRLKSGSVVVASIEEHKAVTNSDGGNQNFSFNGEIWLQRPNDNVMTPPYTVEVVLGGNLVTALYGSDPTWVSASLALKGIRY